MAKQERDKPMGNTVISNGIVIDGEVSGEEPLTILGTVKGKISTTQNLTVEPGATVEADIDTRAPTAARLRPRASVPPGSPGPAEQAEAEDEPDARLEFWHALSEQPVASNDDHDGSRRPDLRGPARPSVGRYDARHAVERAPVLVLPLPGPGAPEAVAGSAPSGTEATWRTSPASPGWSPTTCCSRSSRSPAGA